MTKPIQDYVPQDSVFSMELPRLGVRKYSLEGKEKMSKTPPSNPMIGQRYIEQSQMLSRIENYPLNLINRELKEQYNWGNSFDEQINEIYEKSINALIDNTNTHYCKKSPRALLTPPRRVSKESCKNQKEEKENTPDIFDENTEVLIYGLSHSSSREYGSFDSFSKESEEARHEFSNSTPHASNQTPDSSPVRRTNEDPISQVLNQTPHEIFDFSPVIRTNEAPHEGDYYTPTNSYESYDSFSMESVPNKTRILGHRWFSC